MLVPRRSVFAPFSSGPWGTRRLTEGILISHIFLPFLPLAMAWAVLASPRSGMVNVAVRGLLHLDLETGPLNVFSYGGLLWLSAE